MKKRKTHSQQAIRNTREKVLSFELWVCAFSFKLFAVS